MLGTVGLYVAAALVVLGVLIFVHEAGHFLVAKAVGIQVLRFSLGFGRPLVSWRRGETEYWICWIPLGGYVKMAGLEDEPVGESLEGGTSDVPIDPARAFDRQPLWARILVIIAGVTMNLILAFVIYSGLLAVKGAPRLATTTIDSVEVGAATAGADGLGGLVQGDRITRINERAVASWDEVLDGVLAGGGTEIRFAVEGRPAPVVVRLAADGDSLRRAVARALVPLIPPAIGFVEPGKPAARAGIKPRDRLLRANGDTLRSWGEAVRVIRASAGRPLRLEVWRDGQVVPVTVVPEERPASDTTGDGPRVYGQIGVQNDPPTTFVRLGLGRALVVGADQTLGTAAAVVGIVKGLVTRDVPLREIGGPIAVAQMSGQAARLGGDWFLRFLAFFSVSLAVLNLLPIPVLDGGHLMFLVAEGVRGRPLSVALRTRLSQIGMIVLLGIMALAVTNDVLRNIPR
ncbi:MAG: RIP metalloprotease RseP [Gemmatimonadales bacterium]